MRILIKALLKRVTIHELDTWSMLDIFDRLPLRDLIRVRLVCREWNVLSRKACHARRSLTLKLHPNATGWSPFTVLNSPNDTLVTFQLDHATADYLASTFPNITLAVIFSPPEKFCQMQHLLEHWVPLLQICIAKWDNKQMPEEMT